MTKTTKTQAAAAQSRQLAAKKRARAKATQLKIDAIKPIKTKFSKSQLVAELAARANAPKQGVQAVLQALEDLMKGSVHKRGLGEFTIPGLLKVTTKKVAARKIPARKGGEVVVIGGKERVQTARAAFTKPAHVKLRVRPLTGLKVMVAQ